MASRVERAVDPVDAFLGALSDAGLDLPGAKSESLIQPKREQVLPYQWRWQDIERFFERSTSFVTPGDVGGERRILRLANPGFPTRR